MTALVAGYLVLSAAFFAVAAYITWYYSPWSNKNARGFRYEVYWSWKGIDGSWDFQESYRSLRFAKHANRVVERFNVKILDTKTGDELILK